LESLTALKYSKELSTIESRKVDELQKHMIEKLQIPEQSLKTASGKWKTKVDLLEIVQKHFDDLWGQSVRSVKEDLERNLLVPAPLPLVLNTTCEESVTAN
jgi:hypothetical protein